MSDPLLSGLCKYRPVDERLATSGQPTVPQLHAIAAAGYPGGINLALHQQMWLCHFLTYVHIPVQLAAPTEADLQRFFAAMEAHPHDKVWVHCAGNLRVPVFMGLYRVIWQGWDPERAFALMQSLWPQPDEVWSAFMNTALAKQAIPSAGAAA